MTRRVLPACVLLTSLLAAGCGVSVSTDDGDPSASPSAATTTAPGGSAAAGTSPADGIPVPTVSISGLPGDGGGTGTAAATATNSAGRLPAGFPLPPGSSVGRVVDDGGEIAATLTVPDPAAAATFWKSALPTAGYTVTSAQTAGGFGEIRFSGHGCGGDSQLALQGTTVALQCDRG